MTKMLTTKRTQSQSLLILPLSSSLLSSSLSMLLTSPAKRNNNSRRIVRLLSAIERPPDFSILDNNGDDAEQKDHNADKNKNKKANDDFYSDRGEWEKEQKRGTVTSPRAPRSLQGEDPNRTLLTKKTRGAAEEGGKRKRTGTSDARTGSSNWSSSWMEKNTGFQRFESRPDDFEFDGDDDNSSSSLGDTSSLSARRRKDKLKTAKWDDNRNRRRGGGSDAEEGVSMQQQQRKSRSFREDFRATRVFVQGLPPHTTWQELKDHFRLAGDVVFASISIDPRTGVSKGCGVVQFETTDMAQNAIRIMRNHPLDGETLYVREDYQEERRVGGGDSTTTPTKIGGRRESSSSVWRCANEENAESMSEEERTTVLSLIRARDAARRRRNYDASDRIREELKDKHGVHLDDRLKLWWNSVDGSSVPAMVSDIKGDGRWGALKPWRQIPTTPENDACVNPDLVNGLLTQRDVARREKDFETADMLLEEARSSPDGDLCLRIHDESRTWRIWTDEPPSRPIRREQGDTQKSAVEQCIDLVKEHDPEKLQEIEMLLKKFPGREYNILKKLKRRYSDSN